MRGLWIEALGACLALTAFSPVPAQTAAVTLSRFYVAGPYGQIHIYEAVPADRAARRRTPLVLFHENPVSGREYTILMSRLGADRRVLAPDMPGYGMSDPPPGPLTIEQYAAALWLALHHAGLGPGSKFDVFGFHTGSLVAAELAIAHPAEVRRVVLSGIPYRTGDDRARHLADLDRDEKPTDLDKWFAQMWKTGVVQRPDLDPERAVRRVVDTLLPMNHRWYAYDAVYRYDIAGRLPRVTQPTLVLLIQDRIRAETVRAIPLLPHGSSVDLPGVDHHGFDTAPDALAAAMTGFLDR